MDEKSRIDNESPLTKANFISKLFINWLNPLMKLGHKRPLKEDDLYNPLANEESQYLTEQLEEQWEKEVKNSKSPSIAKALMRVHAKKFLLWNILLVLEEIVRMSRPFIIGALLGYFRGIIELPMAILYGCLLCGGVLGSTLIHHPFFLVNTLIGIKMRLACSGLIYKKALKYNFCGKENEAAGKIMTLMTNDVGRLEILPHYIGFIVVGPIEALLVVIFLAVFINPFFLTALIVTFSVIPVQTYLSKLVDKYRTLGSEKTDSRINILNEVFNGIKIIKMYCWENPFRKIVEKIRNNELYYQRLLNFITGFNYAMVSMSPTLMLFISVTFYIYLTDMPLEESLIVISMSYYMQINKSFGYHFVRSINFLSAANVSLKRVEGFLMDEDIEKRNKYEKAVVPCIKLENVSSSWTDNLGEYFLKNIDINMEKNDMIAVIGPTGSGKTSLLLTILGEMKTIKNNLIVEGSIYYVQQEPWIFNATLRQNVIFGKPYIKQKFDSIVKACSLETDLKLLSDGENTQLGEKGINLSGGQRARVGLARALYSGAQIFLLDDPLSAVDANVGKYLFNECINKYMKNKLRILVTHQIHLLTDTKKIIMMDGGRIKGQGNYDEIMKLGNDIEDLYEEETKVTPERRMSILEEEADTVAELGTLVKFRKQTLKEMEYRYSKRFSISEQFNLLQPDTPPEVSIENKNNNFEEKTSLGNMSWRVYWEFFKAGGGIVGSIVFVVIMISSQAFLSAADYLVNSWASEESRNFTIITNHLNLSHGLNYSYHEIEPAIINHGKYYWIYLSLTIIGAILVIVRDTMFYSICLRASRKLHQKMFDSTMSSPIRFFDLNPLGRITNRFSKDIGMVDEQLPWNMNDFYMNLLWVASSIIISLIINYYIIIPLIPMVIFFIWLRKYFLASSIEIKRIDGMNRSPVLVHFTNTISGIFAIRACKNEQVLYEEFNTHSDYHTRAVVGYVYVTRWFAIRVDWVAAFFIIIVVFSCIFLKDFLGISAGQIGILLVYILEMLPHFQYCLRVSCEIENLMTSVERILEYTSLDVEPLEDGKTKPTKTWPQTGHVKFDKLSFSYAKDMPYVLKEMSFEIQPNEKIGVVGRTGAGKSSIIQALFRMAEPDGKITIDDVNIQDLSLHDLRKQLSIIPQEPQIFIGTMRSNLDPFNEYSDAALWEALDKVQLKEQIQEMPGKLEADVQKGGANLSVGQKQLICLARAIVKKSKILIIDEATANVDFQTDALIQTAIRDAFADCTVITIAHRLQTIIDNDKIMCMDKGKVESYAKPYTLLNDKSSILYELVCSLDPSERSSLMEIAKEAANESTKKLKQKHDDLDHHDSDTEKTKKKFNDSEIIEEDEEEENEE